MNSSSTPLPVDVEVVIPLHNNAAYIVEALRSVLDQTCPPRNVFVIDDGSTDNGASTVHDLIRAGTGPSTVHCLVQPNAGPNSARNKGLALCTATFVAFLDADDVWLPGKLERQLACFASSTFEDLVLVHCGAHRIDGNGSRLPDPPSRGTPLRGHVFDELLEQNRISGGASGVLIRRSVFAATGPFDDTLLTSEDFDMWLRICQVGTVDHVAEDLVALREHGSNTSKNAQRMLEGLLRFDVKWFEHARQRPEVLRYWGHLIALFALRLGDQRKACALVDRYFDRDQQRVLFAKAFGSLKLYIILKRFRSFVDHLRP